MNTKLSKLAVTAGIAITLAASALSASATVVTPMGEGPLKQIHVGLTEDAVRAAIGNPVRVLDNERPGVTMWTYNYTDTFGYTAEFDVDFDASGKVIGTDSLRPKF